MKRDIYPQLKRWQATKNRKPLILRGARQVGKTYLLKTFARCEYASMVYLNFESDPGLAQLFVGKLDPLILLQQLALYTNQKITPETTLLIFDEIQSCPEALNSLKYFQEQAPDYHIVAAGSLLGVKLGNQKGFPVGKVQFMDLYPLTFFEFLSALGRDELRTMLTQIRFDHAIPEPIHQDLIVLLRQYFFIGGMPEAVATYLDEHDYMQVRSVQQDILDAYLLDFAKHAQPHEIMKITHIWRYIHIQLAKENKKFIFSALSSSARAREYEAALQWLIDAGLIYVSYRITTPQLPLSSYEDRQAFKIFLLDVGLLGAMTQLTPSVLLDGHALFTEFKGSLTENFVAQTLMTQAPHQLYYWASTGKAELDFVVPHQQQIYPLEVKAGNTTKHKSLNVYAEKYEPLAVFRSNLLNLHQSGHFYNFPLYLMNQFPTFFNGDR